MRPPKLVTDKEDAVGEISPYLRINLWEIAANKVLAIPFVESEFRDDSTLGTMYNWYARATVVLLLYDELVLRYEGAKDRRLAVQDGEQAQYFEHERTQFSSEGLAAVFDNAGGWQDFQKIEERIVADGRKAKSGDEPARYRLRRNLNLARLGLEKEIVSQEESFRLMRIDGQEHILSQAQGMALFFEAATSRETGPLLSCYARVLVDVIWTMVKPELLERGHLEPPEKPDRWYSC